MKRGLLLLTTALLAVTLVGCAGKPQAEEETVPPAEEAPLRLESLAVELPKSGQDTQALLKAVRELPEALRQALADQGVEVEEVTMTVGSSPAATLQAVEEGGVDLAFLPAEAVAEQETTARVVLVSGPLFWDQGEALENWNLEPEEAPLVTGYRGLICAAPTEYGTNLAGRGEPTWEELDHARWGVLAEDSLLGYRAVDLWLADHYEGNRISDLSDVTEYGDFEALLRAAADGEIDLFPMEEDVRVDWAEAWTLPSSEKDQRGEMGLGRSGSIWEEMPVLGLTDWFYGMAAVVCSDSGELTDARFTAALAEAVNALDSSADFGTEIAQLAHAVLGRETYTPAPEGALNAARRLLTIEG